MEYWRDSYTIFNGGKWMKKVIVRIPGSCGELLQGTWEGNPLLVTCPINRYSKVILEQGDPAHFLPEKAQQMIQIASEFYQVSMDGVKVTLSSELPVGKGMSSSSADISAIGAAIASWGKRPIDSRELLKLCQRIEPTDGTFGSGIVCLDHVKGKYFLSLPSPPRLKIQIYDCGGEIDTVRFNQREDLTELNRKKESFLKEAFQQLREAIRTQNAKQLASAAMLSAVAHQNILRKPHLDEIIPAILNAGALGVNVAHSGTVIGVLWEERAEPQKLHEFEKKLPERWKEYEYLDTVDLIGGGLDIHIEE